MIRFMKIFFVLFLYIYIVFYLKHFELEPIFFIASILFFLSIIISLTYKQYFVVNIFLIVALVNLSMIFALYAYFNIGIIIFLVLIFILFIYCFILISTRKNIQDS
ncbi:hypothetical protein BK128_22050 [Viridibacillus sp. FSL H7-0596]|nr:hypothetical protein BK128_22050 [Viridibacillus sp. FSL H7-0596]